MNPSETTRRSQNGLSNLTGPGTGSLDLYTNLEWCQSESRKPTT